MLRMLKNTKLQKHVLSASKPLRSCLIALSLSACGNAPKFPTDRIWETSIADNVCGEYKLIDIENLKYQHVKDWPLAKCNGNFGFSTADVPKVLRWGEKTQDYVKKNCK